MCHPQQWVVKGLERPQRLSCPHPATDRQQDVGIAAFCCSQPGECPLPARGQAHSLQAASVPGGIVPCHETPPPAMGHCPPALGAPRVPREGSESSCTQAAAWPSGLGRAGSGPAAPGPAPLSSQPLLEHQVP